MQGRTTCVCGSRSWPFILGKQRRGKINRYFAFWPYLRTVDLMPGPAASRVRSSPAMCLRFGCRLGSGVRRLNCSSSVTPTTPGAGCSITAAAFDGRCFFVIDVGPPLPANRTLDFAFFAVVRFAAALRAGLALALPVFEPFLRCSQISADGA